MPGPFKFVADTTNRLQVAMRVADENPCAFCLEFRLHAVPLPNKFSPSPDRVNAELQTRKRLHAINLLPAVFPGVGGFAVGVLCGHAQSRYLTAYGKCRTINATRVFSYPHTFKQCLRPASSGLSHAEHNWERLWQLRRSYWVRNWQASGRS